MSSPIVLSRLSANSLLAARQAGQTVASISPDLGLTTCEVKLAADGIHFSNGSRLSWEAVAEIVENPAACFVVEGDGARKIQRYSDYLQRFYSLMPTASAPTLLIAGFPMHRIKDTDPHRDTLTKLRAIAPVRGRVLDTSTGLGYTAIEAARTAEQVTTIELDPVTLEIARLNPWSRGLFDNPRIQQLVGDAVDLVPTFGAGAFSRILHDPPTIRLAGELYSAAFYRELFRVLQPGGRLYHYIGNLNSSSGRRTLKGVVRRLMEAGFERVAHQTQAFGVVASRS